MKLLKVRLGHIHNVMADPSPDVEILEFTLSGPKLTVRPYCHNKDYWQVYFDANRTIRQLGIEHGYTTPEQHLVVRSIGDAKSV